MLISAKRTFLKWMMAILALTFAVGCSPSYSLRAKPFMQTDSATQEASSSSAIQSTDAAKELLLDMKQLAEQGKVINSSFSAQTTVIENVKSQWGEPDETDWVVVTKGNYATYSNYAMVFGYKESQIFELRSFDKQLQQLSLAKTKEVFGTPTYNAKTKEVNGPFYNKKIKGEEIIGYTAGQDFKIEFVFPLPTASNFNPIMDHYLVLYPKGTVNNMADDPGRQW